MSLWHWVKVVAQVGVYSLIGLGEGQVAAQDYPTRPVRVVVPFAAGGTVDAAARMIGGKLSERLNQSFIVENRVGAGGTLGADIVGKSSADGYTLLLNTVGQAIAPSIFKSLPFDTLNDFTAVTQLVESKLVLVVNAQLPAKSVQELVALARSKPGTLNYGSTGIGTPLSLAMELLKHTTGADIQAVQYRGDAPVMTALITGEVHASVLPLAIARPMLDESKIRALAVTEARRAKAVPELPTIGEAVPAFGAVVSWIGLFAPANTPKNAVDIIQREVATVLRSPDILERLASWGYEAIGSTPEAFATYFRDEVAKYAKIAKDIHIRQIDN